MTRDVTWDTCRICVREIGSVVAVVRKNLKVAAIFLQITRGVLQVAGENSLTMNESKRFMYMYSCSKFCRSKFKHCKMKNEQEEWEKGRRGLMTRGR